MQIDTPEFKAMCEQVDKLSHEMSHLCDGYSIAVTMPAAMNIIADAVHTIDKVDDRVAAVAALRQMLDYLEEQCKLAAERQLLN